MTKSESRAAALLGRKGGRSKSEAKVQAARENGRKGGRPMTHGLNSYRMTFLDNQETRQTREIFATRLKDAVIQAEQTLQKEYGFNCLLIDVKPSSGTV